MRFVTSIPSFHSDFEASLTIMSHDLSHSVATVFSPMISRLIFHFLSVLPQITLYTNDSLFSVIIAVFGISTNDVPESPVLMTRTWVPIG